MRPLHRPMFRYGGPIKEGVMSGIREPHTGGGRAALVGNPMFPQRGGRALHAEQLSFWPNLKQAISSSVKQNPLKVLNPGKKVGFVGKVAKKIPAWWARIKPTAKFRQPSVTQHPGASFKYSPAPYSAKEIAKNPSLWWKAVKENPKWAAAAGYTGLTDPGQAVVTKGIPGALKWGAEALTPGMWEKHLPWNKKEDLPPPPEGDGTSIFETEKIVEPKKSAEEIRAERIQKYRDIMDIKGMNKRAAYDSLIDASKLIQESGDFKGDIKSGKLINDIIQATSKQFDKPSKTKDAIDTLILKGEIEKDIKSSMPTEAEKTAAAFGISKEDYKKKLLGELSPAEIIANISTKTGRVDSTTVASGYKASGIVPKATITDTIVDEWIDDNSGRTEIDYVKEVISKADGFGPGLYVVGDRAVLFDGTTYKYDY